MSAQAITLEIVHRALLRLGVERRRQHVDTSLLQGGGMEHGLRDAAPTRPRKRQAGNNLITVEVWIEGQRVTVLVIPDPPK